MTKGLLPPFVYVLLPDDHTNGTDPGDLTPESMISDNDYATGLLVDQISHSKWWSSTAIFLVEDDSQIGADHVDYHRSICLVMSPWAKHGYVSHVQTSLPSLFRTFEQILGLPPMNRYDALAPALFDVFTTKPDETPFTVLPRTVPDSDNPPTAVGASYSVLMDFRDPIATPISRTSSGGSARVRRRLARASRGRWPTAFRRAWLRPTTTTPERRRSRKRAGTLSTGISTLTRRSTPISGRCAPHPVEPRGRSIPSNDAHAAELAQS